ncbi:allergin-1 [Trichechus manatus latirostris]|uniref:Allergin-1 n=1 Tax=Trichechus manatus latirostris TaxID=127582 RepID=A0A2Y9R0H5_TRIMA|nr:allergin-1 [Trichechus manatus latirostris]XP_023585099.1 allergin-1 [Trichechus manatus latirostris]XP_023585100.1 allergin-1 [Trichechus manatus latirostris]
MMWKKTFLVFLFSLSIQNAVLDDERTKKTDECPSPRLSSQTTVVTKGQNVSLICSIEKKSPTIMYAFYRGDKYLRTKDNGESNIFNLRISEARDLGPYKCKVQDSISSAYRCSKYSPDFNFTLLDPVATPVLNISVIQTEAGLYITLRCISPNGLLPINYTFFEKNVAISPAISKDVREPAEFNFTQKSTQGDEEYRCKAKNRLLNNAKYSQHTLIPLTDGDGCALCLQVLLPGLLLVLIVIAVILACWILPKYKARKSMRDNVSRDYGDTPMEAVEYANFYRNQADKESVPRLEPRQYVPTAQDGTNSQELHYATPTFQKVASGKHEACNDYKTNDYKTNYVYSDLI